MNKNLLIFFIFVIPLINFIFATPVLLSDQGTDLKLVSTGELLSTGNITIYIYDSVTGGSLIYSNLFINNITNGSWNVVINPNLEYGKHYWKDYSVNGDNLNFSGNDRIEFQSPLGLINNASLFNFSLINSCAVGSSIRQVYENGSVLCETDDTGSGGNSSWNQSLANGLYISQVEEDNLDVNSSLYSNSSTWWSGLSSWLSGWFINNAGVLEFNETKLNNTIDSRASGLGDNSSWNQSLANSLYILQSTEGNLDVNSSLYSNSSTWWSGLSSWLSGWFVNNAGVLEFNETKLNNTIDLRAGGDNSSWNESYANTQYADISVVDTQKNASGNYVYNDSTTIYFNETKLNRTIDLRDTNETTRFNNLVGNCSSGDFVFGVDSSGNKVCLTPSGSGDITSVQGDNFYIYNGSNSGAVVLAFNETKLNNTIDLRAGGDNSSWNESYADTQYSSITESLWSANFTAYNNSWSSTFNSTYDGYNSTGLIKNWNSTGYIKDWNLTGLIINWSTDLTNYFTKSQILSFNYWNDTYATFNKTYANTLYASISVTGDNSSWNESYADTQYSSITEPLWSSNFTSYNSSWSSTFNSTYDGYNSTGLIKNWNSTGYIKDWNLTGLIINWSTDLTNYFTKSQILSFNYWNDTYATFNKTYADTLYASISVTGDNSSWNESYANTKYIQNGTNVRFTEVNSTGNITTEEIHFENDIVNHRIYDNSTCVIIKGDTSTMYIC
ncbi:MAG TPA: hypothetical protein VJB35_01540 [Candidatus Nanoarchaeia archaeon]|nr:hypothetical protein [Candidatus Nanoarchaeia archaeon]